MICFIYSQEMTNAFRPTPWHLSNDPFPALRGNSHTYSAFHAVSQSYAPRWHNDVMPTEDGCACPRIALDGSFTKIITTAKGASLLVPCDENEDEMLIFASLRGGFRGNYSRIEAVGAEMLFQRQGEKHCVPTAHIIARLNRPAGYLFAETGRRCGTGIVEVFQWNYYKTMPTEEFEAWREHQPAN